MRVARLVNLKDMLNKGSQTQQSSYFWFQFHEFLNKL